MRISVSTIDRNSLEFAKQDYVGNSTYSVIYKIIFFIGDENQNFWEVFRVLEEVTNIFRDLEDKGAFVVDFGDDESGELLTAETVELNLNQIVEKYADNIWLDAELVNFMKGHHKDSLPASVQIDVMANEIKRLRSEVKSLQDELSNEKDADYLNHSNNSEAIHASTSGLSINSNSDYQHNAAKFSAAESHLMNFRGDDDDSLPAAPVNHHNSSDNAYNNHLSYNGKGDDLPPIVQDTSTHSMTDDYIDRNRRMQFMSREPIRPAYGDSNSNYQNQSQSRSYVAQTYDAGQRTTGLNSEYNRHPNQHHNQHQPHHHQLQHQHNQHHQQQHQHQHQQHQFGRNNNNNNSFQQPLTSGLSDLVLTSEQVNTYNVECDQILQVCGPHEEQVQYRSSVISLLQKSIRKSLSSLALDISLQLINCFLPDDPIKFSVVLSKLITPSTDYSAILENHFKQLADLTLRRSINAGAMGGRQAADIFGNDGESGQSRNHIIKNVKVTKHNVGIKLVCNVDEFIDVEIVFNNRNDLSMMTFIDEVTLLVGQDNLFKRSLMLIRTWWFYETAAYMGSSIKHYLSDYSLCVMIIAIFNQYHKQIKTPLEAMCMFLNEYAEYDGHSTAITLQGIVPFLSGQLSNQPRMKLTGDFLISNQILDKYSFMFRVGQQMPSTRGDRDINQLAINSTLLGISASFVGSFAKDSNDIYSVTLSRRSVDGYLKPIFCDKIEGFTRSTFNIVHPFTYTNMITVNLSHTRLTKLTRAFRIGKATLSKVLDASRDNFHSVEGRLSNFYQVFLARFSNDWRPDILGQRLSQIPNRESPFARVGIDNIWKSILYCNMMMDGIVSDSAILTACVDELTQRSPRSVQDVVRSIAEMVGRQAALSSQLILSEKTGALATVLEKHSQQFVVANKASGNPLIFLCSRLSAEDLDSLSKGIIPPQYQNYLSDAKLAESPRQKAVQPQQRQVTDLHIPQSRNVTESRLLSRMTNYEDLSSFPSPSPSASSSMFTGGNGVRLESGTTGMFFSADAQNNRFPSGSTLSAAAPAWPPNNAVSINPTESRRSQQQSFNAIPTKLSSNSGSTSNNGSRVGLGGSFLHSSMDSLEIPRQNDSGINFDRAFDSSSNLNLSGLRSDSTLTLAAQGSFAHNYYEDPPYSSALSMLGNSIDFSLGSHQQDTGLPSRFSESFDTLLMPSQTNRAPAQQFPNSFRNQSPDSQQSVIAVPPTQQQQQQFSSQTLHGPGVGI